MLLSMVNYALALSLIKLTHSQKAHTAQQNNTNVSSFNQENDLDMGLDIDVLCCGVTEET